VGALPPQTEGVEELIVDTLYDLTDAGDPSPQSFRPRLSAVAFRRMDYQRPVALLPATVVLGTLETLVGYVGSQLIEPTLESLGLGWAPMAKKLSAMLWSAVEAAQKQKPVMIPVGSVAVSKLKPSYQPMLLDQPMSASPANHPCPRRLRSRIGNAELSRAW
jgi:hypothetical protein